MDQMTLKQLSLSVMLLFIFSLFGFSVVCAEQKDPSHYVLVSVAPYKYITEQIADGTVKVGVLVPAGASFHNFEPTPRQVLEAGKADIWLQVGEVFEARAAQAFRSAHPNMHLVDLRKGVDLIVVGEHEGHCCPGSEDLHIWMSPKAMKIQARTIAEALSAAYPENKVLYQQRLTALLNRLDALDQEIAQKLRPLDNRTFMVSHPAYSYYARDYNLVQLPIEFEGKDPTPRQLETILSNARKANVKVIFVQKQYSTKAAQVVAGEIGARIESLDPYNEDYFTMMRAITDKISKQ